jgi:DNA-directed RNA polymerase II subunit RPB3
MVSDRPPPFLHHIRTCTWARETGKTKRKFTNVAQNRPKSENARQEEPRAEGEAFDYDAVPANFYFDLEGVGSMEPDAIIHEGIKELQKKLAGLIHGLGETDGMNGDYDGPRSPDIMDGAGPGWQDQGYTTPYGQAGNASAWGGAATSYGTPYGNSGSGGWS